MGVSNFSIIMQPLTAPSSAPGTKRKSRGDIKSYLFLVYFKNNPYLCKMKSVTSNFATMKENSFDKSFVVDTWNGIDIYSKNGQNGFGLLTKGKQRICG